MQRIVGIRREDKNQWEGRVPISPEDMKIIMEEHGIRFIVQPSPIRTFSDEEYQHAGAEVQEDLTPSSVILGVKEMPSDFFRAGGTYVFFSHTIKGQPHNMPMLKKLMDLGCNLIDYEKISDDRGFRKVFFGIHAGIAGMINGLWMLGQRFQVEDINTPLVNIRQAKDYEHLDDAKDAILAVGEEIRNLGLPDRIKPLVVGFAGYGHVSEGAQEIFDLLPHTEIQPDDLFSLFEKPDLSVNSIYKVIFKECHMVEPVDPATSFDLQDYYQNPEKYRGTFIQYHPYLTMLVNCIFWSARYPRLVTKEDLRKLYTHEQPRFRAVADISCDVEGSVEATLHCTDSGNPVYVYLPEEDRTVDGFSGHGPVILAVDNLPCEISRESSNYFSGVMKSYIPEIACCDFSVDLSELELSDPIKRALIVHNGQLTPDFKYIKNFF